MAETKKHGTGISWTHWPGFKGETWTVIRGCALPPGRKTCVDCYAMVTAHSLVTRFPDKMTMYAGLTKMTSAGPIWSGVVNFDEDQLTWPIRCAKPRCFFLTSMGDLFYNGVRTIDIVKIVAVMRATQRHRYLVLTKRPERMAALLNDREFNNMVEAFAHEMGWLTAANDDHIYWGCSIEDVASAAEMMPELEKVPGNRWTSYEPVIEYVDLKPYLPWLKWVVIGGASKQRLKNPWPYELFHAREIIIDCQEAGVPVYNKQLGACPTEAGQPVKLPEHNNHNDDPQHWPVELRVQQFPEAA